MLAPEDHKKVSFITSDDTFCYVAMSFGLKNAAPTYQRLVDKIFGSQLGRNMEVYVDDMLVTSKEAHNHVEDLEETFAVLRKYRLKLNLGKCAFGVSRGCFLGFMVIQQGIEANPAEIKVILDMGPSINIKEDSMVQYLQQIEELKTKFKSFQLQQIPWEGNVKADSLSKLASALEDCKTRRITIAILASAASSTQYPSHFVKRH
ncbi:UNVERIFIED_CONTAM: Retrovirus-related Pol polyprotein from transposon [Sesamum radiatum]|uniref:Retrovirus-related Pol polyprotein from transposon n=1 Tax=Sesamum radiatum TaxID=300843 RepID=A0AAW2N9Y0_SESRA